MPCFEPQKSEICLEGMNSGISFFLEAAKVFFSRWGRDEDWDVLWGADGGVVLFFSRR